MSRIMIGLALALAACCVEAVRAQETATETPPAQPAELSEVDQLKAELHKLKVDHATTVYQFERQLVEAKAQLAQCNLNVERSTLNAQFRIAAGLDDEAREVFDWNSLAFVVPPDVNEDDAPAGQVPEG